MHDTGTPAGSISVPPFSDSLLHCGQDPVLSSIYLPLGEESKNFLVQIVIAVSNNYGDTIRTNLTVRVGAKFSLVASASQPGKAGVTWGLLWGLHGPQPQPEALKSHRYTEYINPNTCYTLIF